MISYSTLSGKLRKKLEQRRQAHLEAMGKGLPADQYWQRVGQFKEVEQALKDIHEINQQWENASGEESGD